MIDKNTVSILVPVYKVEKYLYRCIDSVLSQDFTDWELILVDDGSPDGCPQICDDYAWKDERVRVVHKENGGLPSARLTAFENASGSYYVFMDSDDYLLPNALSLLYREITKGYDIVRSLVMREDNNGKQWIEHYAKETGEITSSHDYMKSLIEDGYPPYLHSGIYRASLFDRNAFLKNIENGISVGEDWITNFLISKKVNKIKFINEPTYVYCVNTESMVHGSIRAWKYAEKVAGATKEYREGMPDDILTHSKYKGILNRLRFFFMPEIPFNWSKYKECRAVMPKVQTYFGDKLPIKQTYLFVFNVPWLYYVYSRLYCFVFFVFKLKCQKRKELK